MLTKPLNLLLKQARTRSHRGVLSVGQGGFKQIQAHSLGLPELGPAPFKTMTTTTSATSKCNMNNGKSRRPAEGSAEMIEMCKANAARLAVDDNINVSLSLSRRPDGFVSLVAH